MSLNNITNQTINKFILYKKTCKTNSIFDMTKTNKHRTEQKRFLSQNKTKIKTTRFFLFV